MIALAALCACAGRARQQSTGEQIDDIVLTAKVKARPDRRSGDQGAPDRGGHVSRHGAAEWLCRPGGSRRTACARVAHSVNGVQNVRNNLADRAHRPLGGRSGRRQRRHDQGQSARSIARADDQSARHHGRHPRRHRTVERLRRLARPRKPRAALIARGVAGVKEVRNDLQIKSSRRRPCAVRS